MAPKAQTPAPIDRPLSRAYLRGFTGWSTAFPPGQSEPTSLRVMENVMVNRNGAVCTRPGLRFLSYYATPDMNPNQDGEYGLTDYYECVGGWEPFYTINGEKALLVGVRDYINGGIGWRAILMGDPYGMMHDIDDPQIGFSIPQGMDALRFTGSTKHIEYVQINNRIIAMSDAGEDIRVFNVGLEKVAKRMYPVTVPEWNNEDKLVVVQPTGEWINGQTETSRTNQLVNPSFEIGTYGWIPMANTDISTVTSTFHDVISGDRVLKVESQPSGINRANYPLHDLGSYTNGDTIDGWWPLDQYGMDTSLTVQDGWLRVANTQKGEGPFLAYSSKSWYEVEPGETYRFAFDIQCSANVIPQARLSFYTVNGVKIGGDSVFEVDTSGRVRTTAVEAPEGTRSARMWVGGIQTDTNPAYVDFRNVRLSGGLESTSAMTGDSGTNYFWTDGANQSPSVYHPPLNVEVRSARCPVPQLNPLSVSIYATADVDADITLEVRLYDRADNVLMTETYTEFVETLAGFTRLWVEITETPALTVSCEITVKTNGVERLRALWLDAGMIEPNTSTLGTYFDGYTPGSTTTANNWVDRFAPHVAPSRQRITSAVTIPTAVDPKARTLIASGGVEGNPYKIAFFYTFENEIGESAPSRIVEVRMQRPWSNWLWETPLEDADPVFQSGEPSGLTTTNEKKCADQLVVQVPEAVYKQALAEGAIKWHLYALAWSDEDAVPVVGDRVATTFMYDTEATDSLPYMEGGFARITPNRRVGTVSMPLPSLTNRVNYSIPPKSRNGLVAGDRLILVGDPNELGTIKWTSNSFGEYTNFSATTGGGEKTLTSGNMNIPVSVVLWQNPQSVDTITILCQGEDGYSSCHYMSPASVQTGSGALAIMGFEETTNTPGTVSPYAAEVMNNSLFRPTKMNLLKSSATNYNINHKVFSDKIANMWQDLQSLPWMMSAQLDNRLYLLVNNPRGAPLERNCRGNEIWVLDIQAENGHWSRFLIQGLALRAIDIGTGTYMSVTRPEGIYYLDPDYRRDDYMVEVGEG